MASRSSITEKDVAEAFAKIEEELIAGIIKNFERHQLEQVNSGMQWSMWQVEQLANLEAYSRGNVKKYGKRFDQLNKAIEQFISKAYSGGRASQERQIAKAMKQGWTPPNAFFGVPTDKLDALIRATHSDMMKAEYAVLRRANDLYRDTIFKSQVYATSGAGTYAQAIDMATKDFLASGINGIVYSNGSRHTIEEYSSMVIRTSTKRAAFVGEGDAREEWGVHTVFVAERDDACDVCLEWVGQVLIDDVYSNGSSKDGDYPLLSEAMDAGLFHPNCRDTMTTYFEGINKPPKTPTERDKSRAEAREEVEQLENTASNNQARYERLSEYSLDPTNQAKYEAKAEEWGERVDIAAQYRADLGGGNSTPAPESMRESVNAEMTNNGFIVQFGGNEAETVLRISKSEATILAEYDDNGVLVGGNVYFSSQPTISALQEELYHMHQLIRGDYSDALFGVEEAFLRREIDANKHLLTLSEKLKVPDSEVEQTKSVLKSYENKLQKLIEGKN